MTKSEAATLRWQDTGYRSRVVSVLSAANAQRTIQWNDVLDRALLQFRHECWWWSWNKIAARMGFSSRTCRRRYAQLMTMMEAD